MKVVIIGAGIVGLATAYRLLLRNPRLQVLVLEKEAGPARHQSGNNSGVLHSGLYYKPGSKKAVLAVQGIKRMVDFCDQHAVPYDLCGKIVVATAPEEVPRLHSLLQRGTENGLKGLRLLGPEEIRDHEPHAAGLQAIHVPQEGIVDFVAAAQAMVGEVHSRGGEIRFSARVKKLAWTGGLWRIQTQEDGFEAGFLINCAGLHCDRISRMAGASVRARIVPFRGEYYKIKPERQGLVRNLVYPVPDPGFPFLGVHFTRLIHGGVEAGPNAVLAFAREGYKHTDFNLGDAAETLAFNGFWRFFLRYPRMCCEEFRRSFSKRMFCRSLQRLIPDIRESDLEPGGVGVRAQALSTDGELIQDFLFARQPGALHVLNAPSPAATASLAIADEILDSAREPLAV